jgi:hypothetical protein
MIPAEDGARSVRANRSRRSTRTVTWTNAVAQSSPRVWSRRTPPASGRGPCLPTRLEADVLQSTQDSYGSQTGVIHD